MVKNTKGGKSHKSVARKFLQNKGSSNIRIPSSQLELFAIVQRHNGFTCNVHTLDHNTMSCHIRGKFRGRSKMSNLVSPGKLVLIGLRDFEAPHFTTCDLLEVYEHDEVKQICNTEYGDEVNRLNSIYNNSNNFNSHSNTFDFDADDNGAVPEESAATSLNTTTVSYDYSGEIDFDDI